MELRLRPLDASRRLGLFGLALGVSLLSASAAYAQTPTVYGLVTNVNGGVSQGLIQINPTTGASITNIVTYAPLTGVTLGQTLVGMDYRPNTGQLLALGYDPLTAGNNAQLYTLDPATNVATVIGSAIRLELGGSTDRIGFDFNPTVDRIRVVSTNGRNLRLNPNNGALVPPGDPNINSSTTPTPTIGSVAYTNSYAGSTATTLYDIDETAGVIYTQNPANAGTLINPVPLTFDGFGIGANLIALDFDIYYNAAANAGMGANQGFLMEVTSLSQSNFYTFDPATGVATRLGNTIPQGTGFTVRDIAVATAPLTQPTLVGQLLYGVAGGNLISFDSGAPRNIRTAVNITGLQGAQVLAGIDFRPATSELYAFGYDAAAQSGQLYTLNTSTGALAPVGAARAYPLGASAAAIGFDFNPTVDRIRITSATTQANLRANPFDGTYLTDTPLTNTGTGVTPALSAVAYTNNDNNAATGTQLYGYDQSTNFLLLSSNANAGTYNNVGNGSGITVNTANGVDFDIFSNVSTPAAPTNLAFLTATPSNGSFDNLYTVDLGAGTATLADRIGNGSNLSGVAALPTPDPNAVVWTGNVSTDWGTAGNWSPARVPAATDNVFIPSGRPNQPTVSNAQQANNLSLSIGTTLTTATGGVLSLSGNFANNSGSVAGAGSGEVRFVGSAAQSIAGTVSRFQNLTVANAAGVTAGGPVQVAQVLRTTSGNLAAGGNVTLLSNAAGTALIAETGGQVTGNITVQRYIDSSLNSGLGYRHYGAPVSGSTVNDLAASGFSPVVNPDYNSSATPGQVSPFPTVYSYDQGRIATVASSYSDFDKGWASPAALTDALAVGTGYSVNLPASALVDFVGTANRAAVTVSASRGTSASAGWALLANPYPAPFDLSQQPASERAGFDDASYIFQSTSQYGGQYRAYVNGVGGGNPILPVGQGFFKRVAAAGTTGSFTFNPSYRVATFDATPFQRTTADTRPLVHLALRGATGTATDETFVYFEQGATAALDRVYDAVKLPNSNGLNLSTNTGAEQLAINGLPALGTAEVVVPIVAKVSQAGTYLLSAPALNNLPAGTFAYLRDAQTGTLTDLASQPTLSLSLVAGDNAGRFALVLGGAKPLAAAPAQLVQAVAVFPNPTTGSVSVSLPASLASQPIATSLLNSLGQTVRRTVLPAGAATEARTLSLSGIAPGVYSLRLETADGIIAKRLVIAD
ncbi:DUF4394 domain-containing protein [Hymenobacter sp. BT559]|uniref:DUF4394 domain-containing protein n=1 Tax=Hymenobacter sp. BT559 TaxID=2795729 RepID=UPI0018ED6A95|nr:DUF4394 domain-containing protein [Hymenobacter sp. BT559]MBJ6145185.1 DUF4394 domain-containing protein [Hymenobacter sp. BT559]